MSSYDTYYQTENLFGKPYKELISFFKNYPHKGVVLDLGCGQGRNSLALAKIGYKVVGVDNSKTGIEQMTKKAKKIKLNIIGLVEDIYKFKILIGHDIILLDSMFHFFKKDKEKEASLIKRICKELKPSGVLCICIQDSKKKIESMHQAIGSSKIQFEILKDTSFYYTFIDSELKTEIKTKYRMLIFKKILQTYEKQN